MKKARTRGGNWKRAAEPNDVILARYFKLPVCPVINVKLWNFRRAVEFGDPTSAVFNRFVA
jgi:hypothetical protein